MNMTHDVLSIAVSGLRNLMIGSPAMPKMQDITKSYSHKPLCMTSLLFKLSVPHSGPLTSVLPTAQGLRREAGDRAPFLSVWGWWTWGSPLSCPLPRVSAGSLGTGRPFCLSGVGGPGGHLCLAHCPGSPRGVWGQGALSVCLGLVDLGVTSVLPTAQGLRGESGDRAPFLSVWGWWTWGSPLSCPLPRVSAGSLGTGRPFCLSGVGGPGGHLCLAHCPGSPQGGWGQGALFVCLGLVDLGVTSVLPTAQGLRGESGDRAPFLSVWGWWTWRSPLSCPLPRVSAGSLGTGRPFCLSGVGGPGGHLCLAHCPGSPQGVWGQGALFVCLGLVDLGVTSVLPTAQGLRREAGDRAPFLSVWGWWTWGSPLSCPLPRVSAGRLGTGRPFCLSGGGGPGGHLCLAHCPGSPQGGWGQGALFVCLGLVDLGVTSVLPTAQGLRRESGDRAPFLSVWGWWTWGSPLSCPLPRVSAGSLGTGRPFCLSGVGGPGGHLCLAHCPGSPQGVWGQGALFVCLGLVDLGVTSVLPTAQCLRGESGDRAPFLSVWGWWTWGSPLSCPLPSVSAGSLGTGRPFCLSGVGGPGGHLCLAHCPGSPQGVWGQGALFVCLGVVDLEVT